MRNRTQKPALLMGLIALFGCNHGDTIVPAQPSLAPVVDRHIAPNAEEANEPSGSESGPVNLVFAWPEHFVATVAEHVIYRRQVMGEVRARESRWRYALRSSPTDDGFRLYATELDRVSGERLPHSVVEMNALQPSLVIGVDGELRAVHRVEERRALWSELTQDGLDREVSAELRRAALLEDQFVALDPLRWRALVALWNRTTLRQGEVLIIDGWLDPEASNAPESSIDAELAEAREDIPASDTPGIEPRASIQLIGSAACDETSGVECVELRMLNVVEDRRTSPSTVHRMEVTLITEPHSLRPHRLVERTSRLSRFDAIGAVTSTIVERRLLFQYENGSNREQGGDPNAL